MKTLLTILLVATSLQVKAQPQSCTETTTHDGWTIKLTATSETDTFHVLYYGKSRNNHEATYKVVSTIEYTGYKYKKKNFALHKVDDLSTWKDMPDFINVEKVNDNQPRGSVSFTKINGLSVGIVHFSYGYGIHPCIN